jgi:hypothetical protein
LIAATRSIVPERSSLADGTGTRAPFSIERDAQPVLPVDVEGSALMMGDAHVMGMKPMVRSGFSIPGSGVAGEPTAGRVFAAMTPFPTLPA